MAEYRPQPVTVALIRELDKATPPAKPKEIRDKQAGLILRHQPTGHLSLYVELGRGKRERLCDPRRIIDSRSKLTLGQVRETAKTMRGEHAAGKDFATLRRAERAVPTLKAYLAGIYGPWVTTNRRSGGETLARLNVMAKSLGELKLTELKPATPRFEQWRAARQKKVAAETLKKDLSVLRSALTRAVKLEIMDKNPLFGVEAPEVDRHRQVVRALTASEKEALLAALAARDEQKRKKRASANEWRKQRRRKLLPPIGRFADVLTPAAIVSLETGLRRGELFALKWARVDLDEKTLRVEGTTAKTFETRDIPLNSRAHTTLQNWWLQCGKPSDGLVFSLDGEPIANLKKSYHSVLKAAEIKRVNRRGERVNWHSLRHTFGTLLGAAGVDAPTLMKLMGHANLATTQRYLHTDAARKRAAVELLEKAK